jgi:hypothetical protein
LVRSTITILSLLLAFTLVDARQARADLQAWDQEKVIAAAKELAAATVTLRNGFRAKPRPTLGQAGRHSFFSLREEVQVLVSTAARLQRSLEGGAGMEETYPTFRRLVRSGRRAKRNVRGVPLGDESLANIEAVAASVRKLRPFYEAEAPI